LFVSIKVFVIFLLEITPKAGKRERGKGAERSENNTTRIKKLAKL
jgi:hypothetical protein